MPLSVSMRRPLRCGSKRSTRGRPILVEIEGAARRMRLRVTEDAFGYGVMAEFEHTPAEAFEVEIANNRVWITIVTGHGQALPALATPRGEVVRDTTARSVLNLMFGQAIDADGCHGECSDGMLHLSLAKHSRSRASPAFTGSWSLATPAATPTQANGR